MPEVAASMQAAELAQSWQDLLTHLVTTARDITSFLLGALQSQQGPGADEQGEHVPEGGPAPGTTDISITAVLDPAALQPAGEALALGSLPLAGTAAGLRQELGPKQNTQAGMLQVLGRGSRKPPEQSSRCLVLGPFLNCMRPAAEVEAKAFQERRGTCPTGAAGRAGAGGALTAMARKEQWDKAHLWS